MYDRIPIGSRNYAIHNVYPTSLRPSSLFELRHPSRNVSAGMRDEDGGRAKTRFESLVELGNEASVMTSNPPSSPSSSVDVHVTVRGRRVRWRNIPEHLV